MADALSEALRRLPARKNALVTIDSLSGPGQLAEKVAEVLTNPRPIRSLGVVEDLLRRAW